MESPEPQEHIVPYSTFVRTWIALLGLTGLLVLANEISHEALSVWAMLTLTPTKAVLVFYIFMHLKYEKTNLKAMVFVALAFLIVCIGFLFLDISSR